MHLVGEVIDLIDECRDEERADRDDHRERRHVDDPCREASSFEAPLNLIHGRVQGEGKEERDEDPRENVPRDPEHLEDREDGDKDADDDQDRPRTEMDEAHALLGHVCGIADFMIQGGDPTGTGSGGPATRSRTSSTSTRSSAARWPWRTRGRTRTAASSSSSRPWQHLGSTASTRCSAA